MDRHSDDPVLDPGRIMRVCAAKSPDYQEVITWYRDNTVTYFNRVTKEERSLSNCYSLEALNLILYDYEFMPVGFGRRGKGRYTAPEKHQTIEEQLDIIPF